MSKKEKKTSYPLMIILNTVSIALPWTILKSGVIKSESYLLLAMVEQPETSWTNLLTVTL